MALHTSIPKRTHSPISMHYELNWWDDRMEIVFVIGFIVGFLIGRIR
jgi:hypothetical protein